MKSEGGAVMTRTPRIVQAVFGASILAATPSALAHVNPPLVLLSDRDAMVAVLPGARDFPEVEIKLSGDQKKALRQQWGFKAEDRSYKVYEGRDARAGLVGAAVFLTQATIHGPVRVAVGVGRDGRITGAAVVEVSEETYVWVKPLIDQGFTKAYVGLGANGEFAVPAAAASGRQRLMRQFYAKVIASMVQWGAALHQTAGLSRAS